MTEKSNNILQLRMRAGDDSVLITLSEFKKGSTAIGGLLDLASDPGHLDGLVRKLLEAGDPSMPPFLAELQRAVEEQQRLLEEQGFAQ